MEEESMSKKVLTEEHRRNISLSRLGFKHSDETKEKLRKVNLGKTYSEDTREKIRSVKTKNWDDLGYMAKHKRIWLSHGKANKCENVSCRNECEEYEWANISGEYKQDISDWSMMCCQCHKLYDLYGKAHN